MLPPFNVRAFALVGLCVASAAWSRAVPADAVYLDPDRPQAERIADLVSRLTLEENVSLLTNGTPGVPHLGIPKYNWWSGEWTFAAGASSADLRRTVKWMIGGR